MVLNMEVIMLLLIEIKDLALGSPEYITALLFMIFGGLGVFLYGINLMGDSLKAIAGKRLKSVMGRIGSASVSAPPLTILASSC